MHIRLHVFLASLTLALAACGLGGGEKEDPNRLVASGHVEATDVRISTKVAGRLDSLPIQEGDRWRPARSSPASTPPTRARHRPGAGRAGRGRGRARLRLAGPAARTSPRRRPVWSGRRPTSPARRRTWSACRACSTAARAPPRRATTRARAATWPRPRLDGAARGACARLRAGTRREEIDAARARVAAAEARDRPARAAARGRRRSRARSAGVVTEKLAEPGELLQAGAPLCVVTDLADAWLTVYVARARPGPHPPRPDGRGGHRRRPDAPGAASPSSPPQAEFTPEERPDPRRAREARLQGQDRPRQRATASSSPACRPRRGSTAPRQAARRASGR